VTRTLSLGQQFERQKIPGTSEMMASKKKSRATKLMITKFLIGKARKRKIFVALLFDVKIFRCRDFTEHCVQERKIYENTAAYRLLHLSTSGNTNSWKKTVG